jgi:RHS repeat-associated protein
MSTWKRFSRTSPLIRILLTLGLLLATGAGQAIERVTYYHNDALGSPVAATDGNGTLLWREGYAPYGERLTHEASSKDTVWYTGKPEEAAFGLNYFGARWYDPKIGRFMGVDPAGFSADNIQSFNRYAYANNNPYAYVDPDGRNAIWAAEVGFEVGVGLDALVYGITGTALTTYIVDAAWTALHNESESTSSGPAPNNGDAKKHGGDAHDGAINDRVKELKKDPSVLKSPEFSPVVTPVWDGIRSRRSTAR